MVVIRLHAEAHYKDLADPVIPMKIALNHSAAAVWELEAWWVGGDIPFPPERMVKIYDELIIEATWHAVLMDQPHEHCSHD
jgi:hypothetical protein